MVSFELERFEWTPDDDLLVVGRWNGVHGRRIGKPSLTVDTGGRRQRVTGEATPHHLTLTDEAVLGLDSNLKMNPPLRTEADRQALIDGLRSGLIAHGFDADIPLPA